MVAYSNRILDLADECDLNDITQQEIMAMVFITHTRSPQFRQELRRHGVGVTWQFIRKEAQGWDRSKRCEEQSNGQAYAVQRNPPRSNQRNQRATPSRNTRPRVGQSKRELAEAFFHGKCRRCGSTAHSVKECKVSADIVCRNCNKTGHLAKICASHIFNPATGDQQKRRQTANLVEQVDSSDEDAALAQEASALAVSRRVSNPSPVYRC